MRMTFDGDHRSGKGTQIEMNLSNNPETFLVVRGDGSYQGGLDGVLSDEEVAFREDLNEYLYQDTGNKEALWGIAATACAMAVSSPYLAEKSLLIDRGPLSRAAYLLSQGISGKLLNKMMYPDFHYNFNGRMINQDAVPLESVDFGRIIYIRVPSFILLDRISVNDPKADFRIKNIKDKEGLFDKAILNLPKSIQNKIEVVDGNQTPEEVLRSYS